ncbi:MAG: 3-hydroxylacyl-ACP dehydratase [Burkholderiales bacterium]
MQLSREQLLGRIPHAPPMFLLDAVLRFDETSIVCSASSHRDPGHPMAEEGTLGAACAVEYASQAMAAHGALVRGEHEPAKAGFLVAVRDVLLNRAWLHTLSADLLIEANRVVGDEMRVIYEFRVSAGGESIAQGRATVILNVEAG